MTEEQQKSEPQPRRAVTPIPASIVKAIAAVMQTAQAVAKSQENKHGGYKFASTDDIYGAVAVKMGELGLISLTLEDEPPVITRIEPKSGDKASVWLKVAYAFVLATETDTWEDPRARRSLFIQVTGPQTFQAAQSYAEKSWLRSMFKIATGDVDLDSLPEGFSWTPPAIKAPAPPPAAGPLGPTEAAKIAELTGAAKLADEVDSPIQQKAPPPPPAAPEPEKEPGPNMDFALTNFEAALLGVVTRAAAEKYLDAFNAKYDGHIGAAHKLRLDDIYERASAKFKK